MQVHQMNSAPTRVMVRKVHLASGPGAPPSAPCHESGNKKRPTVAAAKPPIQSIGKRTFIMKVSRDESRVAEDSMASPPNGSRLGCGQHARRRKTAGPT